jgi:hypothetical protein
LTYICSVASFTHQFIYSAFVVVLCRVVVFRSGLLLKCIRAFEGYLEVCLAFKSIQFVYLFSLNIILFSDVVSSSEHTELNGWMNRPTVCRTLCRK